MQYNQFINPTIKESFMVKHIILLLLCCLLLAACASKVPDPTIAPTAPPATTEPTTAPTEAPTEALLYSFTLYHGDDNAEKLLPKEVSVPEINETVVIGQLIAAGVLRDGIAVNSIRKNGTQLEIDFNQDFADLVCSMGTSGEYIIVGSTVNTFLSAYEAQSVFFTVNGEILESGHVIYDFPMEFMS